MRKSLRVTKRLGWVLKGSGMAEMLAEVWQEKDEIWFGKRKERQSYYVNDYNLLLFDEFFILWERVI
jgi:hypothetical protein